MASRTQRRLDFSPITVKSLGLVVALLSCVSRPNPTPESTSRPTTEHQVTSPPAFPTEIRQSLLRLARSALELAVRQNKHLELPRALPLALNEQKGAFVTLTKRGELRGCIGNIYPELPLAEAVTTNAYRAALNDPRFPPVTIDELASIEVEVSVLSAPEPLAFASPEELLHKLQPHIDGVVLNVGLHRSTFLPQVWEKLPQPQEFLDRLSSKAGLDPRAWRAPGTEVFIYHAEAFTESELEARKR